MHAVKEIRLNGKPISQPITGAMLEHSRNVVAITFEQAQPAADPLTQVPVIPARSHDDVRAFMPPTPEIASAVRSGGQVSIKMAGTTSPTFDLALYRDGTMVAALAVGDALIDPAAPSGTFSVCYSVVATDRTSRLSSQPSQPYCLRGTSAQSITSADPRLTRSPSPNAEEADASPIELARGTSMTIRDIRISTAGRYVVGVRYSNQVYAHNTGITNAVKRLTITDQVGRTRSAILQMPHIRRDQASAAWRQSTTAFFDLAPGTLTVKVEDFFNMSDLRSNILYTEPGGGSGPINSAVVDAVLIDLVAPRSPSE